MGMTVMEYVLATRIAEAKTLLLSEDLSISQISDRCGFSSVSFFCQVFKAKEGITAKKFRKK
jgi:AraC-like DNA-binding protein